MHKFEGYNPQTDKDFEELRERLTANIRIEQESVDGVKNLLKHFAAEINKEYGPPDIVNERGAIIGEKDNKKIEELQLKFKDDRESFEDYERKKENKHGVIFEMLVTVIFNKILKKEFIVVHTSMEDDLTHHADNIIVEKRTGNVICTLDEANVNKESKRYYKKLNEVENYNRKNGTIIKNGIELNKENKLVETTIKNVPLFLLQISKERLKEVLEKMNIDLGKNGSKISVSKIELEVFSELIESLAKQTETFLNKKLPKEVRENIEKFESSLDRMKELGENFDADK